LNFNTQGCWGTIDLARADRKPVFGAFLEADAAEAFVHDAKAFVACGSFDAQVVGVWCVVYRALIEDVELSLWVAAV
jgi:hypothetical protein